MHPASRFSQRGSGESLWLCWPSLLAAAASGWVLGLWFPGLSESLGYVSVIYQSLLQAMALPLVVAAVLFGFRQLFDLQAPGSAVIRMTTVAFCVTLLAALAGVLASYGMLPRLTAPQLAELGNMFSQAHMPGDHIVMHTSLPVVEDRPTSAVPVSIYGALAQGHLLQGIFGICLFGVAIARQNSVSTQFFDTLIEAVYRALTRAINVMNLALPLVVFGVAVHLGPMVSGAGVRALSSLLFSFVLVVLLMVLCSVGFIAWRTRRSYFQTLTALKEPAAVALVTGNPIAAVSLAIEAMSTKLGCPRHVSETAIPLGAITVRPGMAVYLALVTMFTAGIYGLTPTATDVIVVVLLGVVLAFMSADAKGSIAPWHFQMIMLYLGLPLEAAIIVAMAIDPLCDGVRNLLNLIAVCVVAAWLSEQFEAAAAREDNTEIWRLTLSRSQLYLLGAVLLGCASLVLLLGLGLGARS
ncbi:hypothetical protein D0849_04605 [Bordetella avium]|uniref:dicarboxylate/amino acid:cation symporter n=1 Tax=Bordetella avium TaxID=521 RepID=UPI000E6839B3|nr:cation:dicarboxylase symporter family transporter [Bordetella avium]RIQ18679.1 hypothetical protein D0850_06335 [Bordetella avium]RIQ35285.1 hypothetical protein D0849_04605 [Bordetella avium]